MSIIFSIKLDLFYPRIKGLRGIFISLKRGLTNPTNQNNPRLKEMRYPRIKGLRGIVSGLLREYLNPNCEANNINKIYNPINQNNPRIKKSLQL